MAFIPKDAIWYLAQVVLEINVEGESRNVVHVNYILVRADSAENAYDKAVRLGTQHESQYLNGKGQEVRIRFRGLRNLTVVYEALEDGAEILYEEKVGLTEEELADLVKSKACLGIFAPDQASRGPDYGSEEIRREAENLAESSGSTS